MGPARRRIIDRHPTAKQAQLIAHAREPQTGRRALSWTLIGRKSPAVVPYFDLQVRTYALQHNRGVAGFGMLYHVEQELAGAVK